MGVSGGLAALAPVRSGLGAGVDDLARAGAGGPLRVLAEGLPPGMHSATGTEFRSAFGFNAHRRALLEIMDEALASLRREGVTEVAVGGSFVTTKPRPSDIDLLVLGDDAVFTSDGVQAVVDAFRARRMDIHGERFSRALFSVHHDFSPTGLLRLQL